MWVPSAVIDLARACADEGGRAWLVGGVVRDHLLGRETVDVDLEVHELQAPVLAAVLRRFGKVSEVGRSFGVFRVHHRGLPMDVSLPRRDSNSGPGHRGIAVSGDPFLGLVEAARRRDLTINAIMIDPLTGEVADPFGGQEDLRQGILRAVDPLTFLDDPLRALRVMQLAGRFGFQPDGQLIELCRQAPLDELPGERLAAELEKLLLASPRPSVGWMVAMDCQIASRVLPELVESGTTGLGEILDRAALLRDEPGSSVPPLALMLTCLLHRLEREPLTAVLDRLRYFSHRGYPLRTHLLSAVADWRVALTTLDDRGLRLLAEDHHLALMLRAAEAIGGSDTPRQSLERARALGVADSPLPAVIGGRELSAIGLPPGPQMGQVLRLIRRRQLAGEVTTSDEAMELARRLVGSPELLDQEPM